MMRRVVITALFVLLVALAACTQTTIKAQPLNNTLPEPEDKCANVECGENAYCDAGVCLCYGGFKKCNDQCIPERQCCTNEECPYGKICEKGVCTERPLCGFNEMWSNQQKQCVCSEDSKFCPEQGKCIPKEACCANYECKSNQRCAATTYSASICIRSSTTKCRMMQEGITLPFVMPEGDISVQLQNVLDGPKFDLKVNNDTARRLNPDEQSLILDGSAYIYVESMKVFGGYCREEPD